MSLMSSAASRDSNVNLRPASPAHGVKQAHRVSSQESLTAHPLLFPSTSPLSATPAAGASTAASSQSTPDATRLLSSSAPASTTKYVPYTPRQTRGTAVGTATNMPISVSVSPQQSSLGGTASATSRLQLQNLKAVGQSHGIESNTLGWALLEDLIGGSEQSPLWLEIWSMLASGKAMLLLPTEQLSHREAISPDFVKDHVAFCIGSSRNNSPVVTLSGLRGTIDEDRLIFQSILSTSSKSFKLLANPIDRSATLISLPPLPKLSSSAQSPPEISVFDFIPSLPLPPRSASQHRPPLPPRPGNKQPSAQGVSRLSNPFASFFSKSPVLSSPSSAPQPLPDVAATTEHAIEIPAFTIGKSIRRKNVLKALEKRTKAEIRDELIDSPSWVANRVQQFSENYIPLSNHERKHQDDDNSSQVSSERQSIQSLSAYDDPAEDMSDAFQQFYESMDQELKVEWYAPFQRNKEQLAGDEMEKQREAQDQKVRDTLEQIERTLSVVFYDRLFRPSKSDDASHDEALSSRIAALNMLDLDLGHLGIDVGQSGAEVESIVKACGDVISQLGLAHCPADKAAILVASHRILVDGLSQLPPLHLKAEDQIEDNRTSFATTFEDGRKTSEKEGGTFHSSSATASSETKGLVLTADSEGKSIEGDGSVGNASEDNAINRGVTDDACLPAPAAPILIVLSSKPPTPVSSDILLPLIIFSVVKANPPQLVSHLLFTQRFRNRSFGGEEGYCLINLMAVVEFLENVDLGALGLKESEKKVMSTADLTPIPLTHPAFSEKDVTIPIPQESLRGRVGQQVDAFAGSANKMLSGVVDSGVGVLRALLPTGSAEQALSSVGEHSIDGGTSSNRPGFGLLRREGFSIAGLAVSLPGSVSRARPSVSSRHPEDEGQEMVESHQHNLVTTLPVDDATNHFDGEECVQGGAGSDEEEEMAPDARSIRSFESMMSRRSAGKQRLDGRERMSLSDRLAHMSRLTKSLQDTSAQLPKSLPPRSSSLLMATDATVSRPSSPASLQRAMPPIRRFLECSPHDLRISEIPELLRDYRRLADILNSMGLYDEHI